MEFTSEQMDALQEMANIGAAHSATTLSQMLDTRIGMNVPDINIVDIGKVGEFLTDELTTMIIFELQGDIPHGGFLVLHFPRDSAIRTAGIMQGSAGAVHTFDEMDQSTIIEVGNIMISSFLSATSDLLGFMMLPSPPVLVVDMAHAAITSLIAQMTIDVDDVILFQVRLSSEEYNIAGNILIFLEISTLRKVEARLEEMIRSPPGA
ncbi:MAG: chemotaxis protein CheC [Methanoregula sp.]|jgi:chemotaxis protein CheC|uniref:chemotaxis protein CheC n=1 Tax=Methanoregula sp. TaxID=2052170 RepID=UPI0025F80CAD|nr:chemotaxis protein CheC [Methanoregula sp.]MCK9630779.1 chemotaxis protein CheC [Methanoregula sp.]